MKPSCDVLEPSSDDVEPRYQPVMKGWTAETKTAIEAVTFIAAHLKNEDDYAEVIDYILQQFTVTIRQFVKESE